MSAYVFDQGWKRERRGRRLGDPWHDLGGRRRWRLRGGVPARMPRLFGDLRSPALAR
jgi:hypothetical protein